VSTFYEDGDCLLTDNHHYPRLMVMMGEQPMRSRGFGKCVPPASLTFIPGRVAMLRMTGQLVAKDLVRRCIRVELSFVKCER